MSKDKPTLEGMMDRVFVTNNFRPEQTASILLQEAKSLHKYLNNLLHITEAIANEALKIFMLIRVFTDVLYENGQQGAITKQIYELDNSFPGWLVNMSRCLMTALACYKVSKENNPNGSEEEVSRYFARLIHNWGFNLKERNEGECVLYLQNITFGVDFRVLEWMLEKGPTFLTGLKKKTNNQQRGKRL